MRWTIPSTVDNIPNPQKLALFVRALKRTQQMEDFCNMNKNSFETVVDGVINKAKYAIKPLLKYKSDSTEINNALSDPELQKFGILQQINAISRYLDNSIIKNDLEVYRGDKTFWILNLIEKNDKDLHLPTIIENFSDEIQQEYKEGIYNPNKAKRFADDYLLGQKVKQPRFGSTAMVPRAADPYTKKIRWKIKVPAGTKASSIEGYNVYKPNEAELLLQRNSIFNIQTAEYKPEEDLWYFDAEVEQGQIE